MRPPRSPVLILIAVLAFGAGVWRYFDDRTVSSTASDGAVATAPAAPASTSPGTPPSARTTPSQPGLRRDLSIDEGRGGHTLARHVGLSDGDLRDRLASERNISAASTYTDRRTAETIVGRTLSAHQQRVDAWVAREGNRPNLSLSYRGQPGAIIGRSARRGSSTVVDCIDAVVVLRWGRGNDYYVLTSYPEARR